MANKRMFNKEVTSSDVFLDMPLTSQCLYFHLGMQADDDGFVSPKSIIRLVGAKDDDLNVLILRGFVIQFGDGVIVITHWKRNNNIRSDRYSPTVYKEHLKILKIDNNVYINEKNVISEIPQSITDVHTNGVHSIGKDSIDIDKNIYIPPEKSGGDFKTHNENNTDAFEIFWKIYPHARKGKKSESLKHFKVSNADDVMNEVKFLNWKIKFGIQDGKFMPACERRIRDFTITSEHIKEKDIKSMINSLMHMPVGEKRSEYYKGLSSDFGKENIDLLVKERNKQKNGISLNLK